MKRSLGVYKHGVLFSVQNQNYDDSESFRTVVTYFLLFIQAGINFFRNSFETFDRFRSSGLTPSTQHLSP